ncbi:MAG: FecR domain-containing protein [Crocinitomicaceae bacterium]|nr:FecR domain-containing protein [Crocinitomicaceae bacterium]
MADINDILARHFSGDISEDEKATLSQWIDENPTEYELLKKSWDTPLIDIPSFSAKNAWNKVDAQLESPVKKLSSRFYWIGAAASIALIVTTFLLLNNNPSEVLIANTSNEAMEHTMPDGSQVWLSAGSEIAYLDNFEEERNLELKGTAYFEVDRDENHPFVVGHTFGEVEVLGTGFTVEVEADYTTVSVDHGRVAVRDKNEEEVILNKGESTTAGENGVLGPISAEKNVNSWKTGSFVFEDEYIQNVLEDLNSYYEKEITLASGTYYDSIPRLTATFENQKLEDVVEIIVVTCRLKVDYQEEMIVLSN